jgi:hypothetical protein
VLQAIVADHDVHFGMALSQGAGRSHPVTPDEHRRAAAQAQQQGLVACRCGRCVGHDLEHVIGAAAMPARDDAGLPAFAAQQGDQREHGGSLAGTTCHEVADHQHRHVDGCAFRMPRP